VDRCLTAGDEKFRRDPSGASRCRGGPIPKKDSREAALSQLDRTRCIDPKSINTYLKLRDFQSLT
jgi:hypothetical protein